MERNFEVEIVAMSPAEEATRQDPLAVDYAFVATPFGEALAAATWRGICALWFADDRAGSLRRLREMFPHSVITEHPSELVRRVEKIFGPDPSVDGPLVLHLKGTPFQLAVWRALVEIPIGTTATYSNIAARVGRGGAHRAVGTAVGANPVAIIIPCHRVVPRAGGIGAYRWGVERKKELLDSERE